MGCRCRSDSEDLRLRGAELLIGENALGMKRREVLELCRRVLFLLRRRWRLRVLRLLGVLLSVLLVPPSGLTTLHASGHSGGSSRDNRGAGCHSEKSHDASFRTRS